MNILVVEDENSIREIEVAYLKKAGYTIYEAETGSKALSIFEKSNLLFSAVFYSFISLTTTLNSFVLVFA